MAAAATATPTRANFMNASSYALAIRRAQRAGGRGPSLMAG